MTLTESFALVSFTLFSFADLRYRLVPGIELLARFRKAEKMDIGPLQIMQQIIIRC